VRISVPAVEVADEVCSQGIGSPFAVGDGTIVGDREAEALITPRELLQPPFRLVDLLDPLLGFAEAAFQGGFEGFEVWVELDDAWGLLVF